jgi:hypothetical protein
MADTLSPFHVIFYNIFNAGDDFNGAIVRIRHENRANQRFPLPPKEKDVCEPNFEAESVPTRREAVVVAAALFAGIVSKISKGCSSEDGTALETVQSARRARCRLRFVRLAAEGGRE